MPMLKVTKLRPDIVPNPEWKRAIGQARRQVVLKIGQITNTPAQVERVVCTLPFFAS